MTKVNYATKQYPKCEQERFSCAMCKDGRCQALHDTHFTRPCPFFKTKAQITAERKGLKKW